MMAHGKNGLCRALAVWLLLGLSAQAGPIRLRGAVRLRTEPAAATVDQGVETVAIPPVEGPVIRVAMVVTDQRRPEDDPDLFFSTAHVGGVEGLPLPGATVDVTTAVLDSGAGTHLLSYPDAAGFGVQGAVLTGESFSAGGVGGTVSLDISYPLGLFAHGLQDLAGDGTPQAGLMLGQGNFACGANSLLNAQAGIDVPTVLGSPFLAFFPVSILNSAAVKVDVAGRATSSASVTFYPGPDDPQIPQYAHRIYLALSPGSSGLLVFYLGFPDENLNIVPVIPSLLSGDSSLFFTASAMQFSENGRTSSGQMMVDTGAQATLISSVAAAELSLNLLNPDFEVDVQGLAGTVTAPGFFIDQLTVPAGGGDVVWVNVPVIVLDVSGAAGVLYGIFGTNLLANRDVVFNGAAALPYLDVTEPVVAPVMEVTETRFGPSGSVEFDWHTEPAPPVLYLQQLDDLTAEPASWTTVATGELATIQGTLSVTGVAGRAFLRLWTP